VWVAGEELTFDYTGLGRHALLSPKGHGGGGGDDDDDVDDSAGGARRRRWLSETKHFSCTCALCVLQTGVPGTLDTLHVEPQHPTKDES
jgi:hypothetical protein